MPRFETSQDFAFPVERVFDVFARPANLEQVMPPELHFRVLEALARFETSYYFDTGRLWSRRGGKLIQGPQRQMAIQNAFWIGAKGIK